VPLPDDLPVIERSAVRLVVLDTQGRLLLFHTPDIDYPELGTWWELPAVASVSTQASCPRCSMPSSTARKSMNHSSSGHNSAVTPASAWCWPKRRPAA
jgi:hypothetical protein